MHSTIPYCTVYCSTILNPGLGTVSKQRQIGKTLSFEKRRVDVDEEDSDVNESNIVETAYVTGYPSQGPIVENEENRSNNSEVEEINPVREERKDDYLVRASGRKEEKGESSTWLPREVQMINAWYWEFTSLDCRNHWLQILI